MFMWLDMIMYTQMPLKQACHGLSFSGLGLCWLWLYIFALRVLEKEKMAFIQRVGYELARIVLSSSMNERIVFFFSGSTVQIVYDGMKERQTKW